MSNRYVVVLIRDDEKFPINTFFGPFPDEAKANEQAGRVSRRTGRAFVLPLHEPGALDQLCGVWRSNR